MEFPIRMVALVVVLVACMLGAGARPCLAQPCGPQWLPGHGVPGVNGAVYASTLWDPDGPGPRGPLLVVGGDFTVAGGLTAFGVAAWDPVTGEWSQLGGLWPVQGLLAAPNGDLLAGTNRGSVHRWDGSVWRQLGSGTSHSSVHALLMHSSGDLIAGGNFVQIGGVYASNIARWDGVSWAPLGAGLGGEVLELAELPGREVVAAGNFTSSGVVQTGSVAVWDWASWAPLGGTPNLLSTRGLIITPEHRLFAADQFNIRAWDGESWEVIGQTGGGHVSHFALMPNGDLVAAGRFTSVNSVYMELIARWDGVSWSPMIHGTIYGAGHIYTATPLPDGGLVAGGSFLLDGDVSMSNVGRWTGSTWVSMGCGLDGSATALLELPSGGVVVGGAYASVGSVVARRVALWDGADWQVLGAGFRGTTGVHREVSALAVLANGEIVAGGNFANSGATSTPRIARWDGEMWHPLGSGLIAQVNALAVLPNGDIIAGGSGQLIPGCTSCTGIARWDGQAWSPLGTLFGSVRALMVLPSGELIAGGAMGGPSSHVARWNGASWTALGTLTAGGSREVRAIVRLPNGDLVVGGSFTAINGVAASNVARWNGSAWSALGAGVNSTVNVLAVLPNGELVAGGSFLNSGGAAVRYLARWNGAAWSPLGPDLSSNGVQSSLQVRSLAVLFSGELVVGGSFSQAGGLRSAFLARWSETGIPWIARGPRPTQVEAGATAELSVVPATGYGGLTFQWRKDGEPLVDGVTPHGSVLFGAQATTLSILNAGQGDAGAYTVVIGNSCGYVESASAALTVPGGAGCPPDWNGDGLVNSADTTAFLTAWLSSLQEGTLDADFNADGQVNSGDITAFLAAWLAAVQEGGC